MQDIQTIDIAFDMYSDVKPHQDPDLYSKRLKRYHQLLWSKPLPNGKMFSLERGGPKFYLKHTSELGEYHLTSDTITHSYRNTKKMSHIPREIKDSFFTKGSLIGAYIVFPKRRIKGIMTINQARGCHYQIGDRFDLTLECIRRLYKGGDSPLQKTLLHYQDFFELFGDFKGYIEFFLLQDLIENDFETIKFYLPFDEFRQNSPYPQTIEDYCTYRSKTIEFIEMRNARIEQYSLEHLTNV